MGIHLLRVKLSTPPPSSFPHFASHTPFLEPLIEEKLKLQKSMKAMLEAQK